MVGEKVGTTGSGKTILLCWDLNIEEFLDGWLKYKSNFSSRELLESYCIFEYLAGRETQKKFVSHDRAALLEKSMNMLKNHVLGVDLFRQACFQLGLELSYNRVLLGKTLVTIEFRD